MKIIKLVMTGNQSISERSNLFTYAYRAGKETAGVYSWDSNFCI